MIFSRPHLFILVSSKLKYVIYAVGDFFFVVGNKNKAFVCLIGKGGNHF